MKKNDLLSSENKETISSTNFPIMLNLIIKDLLEDLDVSLVKEQIESLLISRNTVLSNNFIRNPEQRKLVDEVFPIKDNKELLKLIIKLLEKTIFNDPKLKIILPAFLDTGELEEILIEFEDRKDIRTWLEKKLKQNSLSNLEESVIKQKVEDKLLTQIVNIFKIWWKLSSKSILDYLSSIEELDLEKDFDKISFLAKLAINTWDNDSIMAIYNFFLDYASKTEDLQLISKIEKIFTWVKRNLVINFDLDKAIYNIDSTEIQDILIVTLIENIKSNLNWDNDEKNSKYISSYAMILKSIVEMSYYKKVYIDIDYIVEEITQILSKNIFDNISVETNEDISIVGHNLGLIILVLNAITPKTIDVLSIKRAEELCKAISTPLQKNYN